MNSGNNRHLVLNLFTGFFLVAMLFGFVGEADARTPRCEWPSVEIEDARVYTYLGDRFNYRIDINGSRDTEVETKGLPDGLYFDSRTETIKGRARSAGTFNVTIAAKNHCGTDYSDLRIVVRDDRRSGASTRDVTNDPNVTIDSELRTNRESGVSLSDIPYTGTGDLIQYSLVVLALLMWLLAVTFAVSGNGAGQKIKRFFFTLFALERNRSASFIDKSVTFAETDLGDWPLVVSEESDEDDSELQSLRAQASEEKIIFTEATLREIVRKANDLGGSSNELLASIIDVAKGEYPRIDGYIKIDPDKLKTLL